MNPAFSNEFESRHLPEAERIRRGSFYTPEKIARAVHSLIEVYKARPRAVVFDSAAGMGAFLRTDEKSRYKTRYRAAEIDPLAGEILKNKISPKNLFIGNALLGASRRKFRIAPEDFLIQIGNPPYNDITSAYRSGRKGKNICDKDLFDRDLGISFLKFYNKLAAGAVCVLHPLSYLIKESNFRRLKGFAQNYRLKKALLFSSGEFQNVSRTNFPIAIALYERSRAGMSYEEIKAFSFQLFESEKIFRLRDFPSTDSFIRKYPPKKSDPQISDIGVYYRPFRDINSLIRNQGFHIKKSADSIPVQAADFYKYAYLFAFKKLFRPKGSWLYGNLSPFGDRQLIERHKNLFVLYALLSAPAIFSRMSRAARGKIFSLYSLDCRPLNGQKTDPRREERLLRQAGLKIQDLLRLFLNRIESSQGASSRPLL